MSDIRDEVRKLSNRSKNDLKTTLEAEMGEAYGREITDSLRNDFLRACYASIEPESNPSERVTNHKNYDSDWGEKKKLATALRMLLTERVGRSVSDGITSMTNDFLAEVIVAIRRKEEFSEEVRTDVSRAGERDGQDTPPQRAPLTEAHLGSGVSLTDGDLSQVEPWVNEQVPSLDDGYLVYVLDCTPPLGDEEGWRTKLLRREAREKRERGERLTDRECAAIAVTEGKRLYYVGYTGDLIDRLNRHIEGASAGGAEFLNIFNPQRLVEVSHYQTEEAAIRAESHRASELARRTDSFSYYS